MNLKEYEQRLADHHEAVELYQQRAERNITSSFQAEGYRPPSILSIFSVGLKLENFLHKIVRSRDGNFSMSNEANVSKRWSHLFGKIELLFNVSFVISLLMLIFSFNAINGEKEKGTNKFIISNPVLRWQIWMGKIIGNHKVLMIPFIIFITLSKKHSCQKQNLLLII